MERKQQPNREVFRCNISHTGLQQGQRRGCCNFQTDDVAQSNTPIDLILLSLSQNNRTDLRRRSKIGEDGSDPPLEGVPIGPSRGCDVARLDSAFRGSLPSDLSLREASKAGQPLWFFVSEVHGRIMGRLNVRI